MGGKKEKRTKNRQTDFSLYEYLLGILMDYRRDGNTVIIELPDDGEKGYPIAPQSPPKNIVSKIFYGIGTYVSDAFNPRQDMLPTRRIEPVVESDSSSSSEEEEERDETNKVSSLHVLDNDFIYDKEINKKSLVLTFAGLVRAFDEVAKMPFSHRTKKYEIAVMFGDNLEIEELRDYIIYKLKIRVDSRQLREQATLECRAAGKCVYKQHLHSKSRIKTKEVELVPPIVVCSLLLYNEWDSYILCQQGGRVWIKRTWRSCYLLYYLVEIKNAPKKITQDFLAQHRCMDTFRMKSTTWTNVLLQLDDLRKKFLGEGSLSFRCSHYVITDESSLESIPIPVSFDDTLLKIYLTVWCFQIGR